MIVRNFPLLLFFLLLLPEEGQYVRDLLGVLALQCRSNLVNSGSKLACHERDSINEMNGKCQGAREIMNDGNFINI